MKKKRIIFLRIVSIIDMVGIMLVSFLCLGGLLTCIILCILFTLIQSDFNKIVDKLGIRKLSIILLSPQILLLLIVILLNVQDRITTVSKWLEVKNDFENINEIVINYYDEDEYNKDIVKYSKETDKSICFYLDKLKILNSNKRLSFDNVMQYYKENARIYKGHSMYVLINEHYISYYSDSERGTYEVIYFKNKPKYKELSENNLEHLTGNWYKTVYIHHI